MGQDELYASLKEKLGERLAAARAELERLDKKLETKADYGLGIGDPNIYEWEMNLALRQKAESKIKSIESALQRMEQGTYGRCEKCSQPIDPERLEILPEANLCVKCAKSLGE